jgi:protein-S-isoprenylcysteine O-methyltransferase Ste14
MLLIKLYIFSGLILHKVIWEFMRDRSGIQEGKREGLAIGLTKAIKIGILLGILIQVWLPDVFPISVEPQAIRIIGILIFTIGLSVALIARFQLGDNWSNIESGQVLTHQKVVSRGIYRLIRHPIYTGDLLLLLGLELAMNSWLVLGVLILAPVVMIKAITEEKMLVRELSGYGKYCQETKRFIPFVV